MLTFECKLSAAPVFSCLLSISLVFLFSLVSWSSPEEERLCSVLSFVYSEQIFFPLNLIGMWKTYFSPGMSLVLLSF